MKPKQPNLLQYMNFSKKNKSTNKAKYKTIMPNYIDSFSNKYPSYLQSSLNEDILLLKKKLKGYSKIYSHSSNNTNKNEEIFINDNNPINIYIKEINNNKIIDDEKKEKNNDTVINNKNGKIISTAVKIPNEIINNIKNKKNLNLVGSLASITSSEFREGCPGPDSFLSTVKFDDMNGTRKTNGLKEIQKSYNENNNV